jgi:hypothetical protein
MRRSLERSTRLWQLRLQSLVQNQIDLRSKTNVMCCFKNEFIDVYSWLEQIDAEIKDNPCSGRSQSGSPSQEEIYST